MKLLFDLFPILLFFIAYKVWGIFTATAITIVATLIQIAWVAYRQRRVDPMLWISLGAIVILGGATLIFHNETFIKWKPTALYWALTIALLVAMVLKKNPLQAMLGKQLTVPAPIWQKLTLAWAIFFLLLGILNIFIAYTFSTDAWVNFKLFGSTAIMFIFIIAQSIWLSRYIQHD